MKGLGQATMKPRQGMPMAMSGKRDILTRRAGHHNAHVLTPHGKHMAGRKGRKG